MDNIQEWFKTLDFKYLKYLLHPMPALGSSVVMYHAAADDMWL